jgi:hypothetical protein
VLRDVDVLLLASLVLLVSLVEITGSEIGDVGSGLLIGIIKRGNRILLLDNAGAIMRNRKKIARVDIAIK